MLPLPERFEPPEVPPEAARTDGSLGLGAFFSFLPAWICDKSALLAGAGGGGGGPPPPPEDDGGGGGGGGGPPDPLGTGGAGGGGGAAKPALEPPARSSAMVASALLSCSRRDCTSASAFSARLIASASCLSESPEAPEAAGLLAGTANTGFGLGACKLNVRKVTKERAVGDKERKESQVREGTHRKSRSRFGWLRFRRFDLHGFWCRGLFRRLDASRFWLGLLFWRLCHCWLRLRCYRF